MGSINRKKTQWTEELIIEKLSNNLLSSSAIRYLMNNLYVFSNSWESDYLSLTNSGYFYEGEVKISKSDFKADFKKEKKHLILESNFNKTQTDNNLCPHYFFYAVPEGLIDVSEVPEYAGLIYMIDVYPYYKWVKKSPLLHKEKYNDIDLKLQDKFYYNMINWKRKALKEYPHQINKMKELIKESKTDENGKKYRHTLSEYDNLLKMQEEINENQKRLIYDLVEECNLYKDEIRALKKEREA